MSLINDALRRARHEANRKEALAKGGPMPPGEVAPRRSGRLGSMAILVVLGIGLGAALVGGGVVLFGGWRAAGPTTVDVEAQTSPAAAAEPTASRAPESGSGAGDTAASVPTVATVPQADAPSPAPAAPPIGEPELVTIQEAQAEEPSAATGPTAGPMPSGPGQDRVQPAGEPQFEPDLSPLAAARPATPAAARSAGVRSFVYQAELAGGGAIELGGIAWSESGPSFALLNGRVVSPGEYVEGYKILQIDSDQVELEADGDRLLIRLK